MRSKQYLELIKKQAIIRLVEKIDAGQDDLVPVLNKIRQGQWKVMFCSLTKKDELYYQLDNGNFARVK